MAESFFDTLSVEEKQQLKDRMVALTDLMTEWVRAYPLVRAVRIPPVALLMAAITPRLSLPTSLLIAKIVFWIFELDDLADERAITLPELQQKIEVWYRLARDGSPDEKNNDELAAMLLEIRESLSGYPLFEPLREVWATQVRLLAEAGAQEYQYGLQYSVDPHRLPSLDEYLRSGVYSLGFPLWALTTVIVVSDASALDCLEAIQAAVRCGSAAIRLYNDYQTLDKELQEGTINSAIILEHALRGGDSDTDAVQALVRARQRVLQLADAYAQQCGSLVRQIQTDSGQIEETISYTVAFSAQFYREYDYHTSSAADTTAMVDGRHN